MMRMLAVFVLVSVIAGFAQAAAGPATRPAATQPSRKQRLAEAEEFFAEGPIPRIRIEVNAAGMKSLRENARAYVKATVRESVPGQPDRVYNDVAIHLKGAAGSFRDVNDRPALTLNFDKFVPSARFHGLSKIHLNNSVQDGTYMEENLCGMIARDAGLAAPRVTYARVWLNKRDLGFYVLKEGFDKTFIYRFFGQTTGDLLDGGFCADIDQDFRKMIDDPADKCDPKKLIEAARERDPVMRRQKVEKVLDVEEFQTFMAFEGLTADWDGYSFNRNNYRIYHNPKTDKFVFLVHGMDQMFRNSGHPLIGDAAMCRAVLQGPEDRARYMQRVMEVRQKCFDPDRLDRCIDGIAARITPVLAEMDRGAAREFRGQTAELKARMRDRVRNVDRMLSIPTVPLKFDAGGVASLKGWGEQGEDVAALDRFEEGGKPRLRIRARGEGPGSFRTTVILARGRYTFEGLGRVAKVVAPSGENSGAGLRISGGTRQGGLTGDTNWRKLTYDFEVTENVADVVLVVELRAEKGEAVFDAESLKLRKR